MARVKFGYSLSGDIEDTSELISRLKSARYEVKSRRGLESKIYTPGGANHIMVTLESSDYSLLTMAVGEYILSAGTPSVVDHGAELVNNAENMSLMELRQK